MTRAADDQVIGAAVGWLRGAAGCAWPEDLLWYTLEIPVARRQAAFHHDADGMLMGAMLWAFVGDDIHRDLCDGASKILHLSEWTEGLNAWVWIVHPAGLPVPRGFRRDLAILAERYGLVHVAMATASHAPFRIARWSGGLRFDAPTGRDAAPPPG